ncbi:hypothetical protein [Wolbachia endosymbiont (group A) of Anomoia purmunda]|uniref:hypothetical protein n=1 Tax=Wolbachia endosymbiont (group A) of Anomoia purmunda TaxID=2953978 RepID=UPI00222E1C80|nr:hypothetical protein [Wolbachia endosymbiont (group A) of Anomoia purmunda]
MLHLTLPLTILKEVYSFSWIPVSGHWDDKKRSTGMIAVLRHTAAVSLDPANT